MQYFSNKPIVIASPHARNDSLEVNLRNYFSNRDVVRLRSPQELTFSCLEKLNPEYIFFPHWSWLIPKDIFFQFECVIFHMTDLPYGRGGSPLQNLIVRGNLETKLTALKCVSELDAGPIYMKRDLSLQGTAEEILQRASTTIEEMIVEILKSHPAPVLQCGEVVEFKRRQPKDGDISELVELSKVFDFIRMLDAEGYPHAFLATSHLHVEFMDAHLTDEYLEAMVRIRKKNND
jgi:methionyl-tRNA formyltransferase